MQIKAGIRKEWFQFTRTFRLGGVLLGILSFAIVDPLIMFGMNMLLRFVMTMSIGGADMNAEIGAMFGLSDFSAAWPFSAGMGDMSSTSLLIAMLVMMSPCGGEQKKRATIIPSCTGLGVFEYLVPKYFIYPLTIFVTGFLGCCICGALSDLLFRGGFVSPGIILLGALMCAVYMTFIFVVYMSIGLCTSHPGAVTAILYVGISLVQMILTGLDLNDFHPLTLRTLVSGVMFTPGFVLADNVASIIVGILLSVVIGVMMFILTLTVLKGKRINNQEDKPEF